MLFSKELGQGFYWSTEAAKNAFAKENFPKVCETFSIKPGNPAMGTWAVSTAIKFLDPITTPDHQACEMLNNSVAETIDSESTDGGAVAFDYPIPENNYETLFGKTAILVVGQRTVKKNILDPETQKELCADYAKSLKD